MGLRGIVGWVFHWWHSYEVAKRVCFTNQSLTVTRLINESLTSVRFTSESITTTRLVNEDLGVCSDNAIN